MLNKEELREQLVNLSLTDAMKLVRKEIAFWDTDTMKNLEDMGDTQAVMKFLLEFTPVEAVAMVSLMPRLVRGYVVKEICEAYNLQTIGVALRSWGVVPSEFLELKNRIPPFVELFTHFRTQLLMDDSQLAKFFDGPEDPPY